MAERNWAVYQEPKSATMSRWQKAMHWITPVFFSALMVLAALALAVNILSTGSMR